MSEIWDIRIERRESINGPVIAGSRQMVTVEADESTRGDYVHWTVDKMLDGIVRLLRKADVGEE